MDGMRQDRVSELERKNRRVGLFLAAVTVVLFIYSFLIVRRRGNEPEPANLTPGQKILRGL